MPSATAIKVVIGLRANGHADHPDWTTLDLGGDTPEEHQIIKWRYDKTSGHDQESEDSPIGQQFGLMLVTPTFAAAALTTFPSLVTQLTEVETRQFWEERAHAHLPDETRDADELSGLRAEFLLTKDLAAEFPSDHKAQARVVLLRGRVQKALDPNDREKGIIKNIDRRWTDAKVARNITFVEPT